VAASRKPFAGSWEDLLERPIYTFPPVNNWSGAALIAGDGRLVGIGSLVVNDAGEDRRGLPGNLFVPVNLLKPILADLLAQGRRSAPVQPWPEHEHRVRPRQPDGGAGVARGGPAERAGVDPGDIALSSGGQRVAVGQADFDRRLWGLGPAGAEVTLRLLKDGEVRELPGALGGPGPRPWRDRPACSREQGRRPRSTPRDAARRRARGRILRAPSASACTTATRRSPYWRWSRGFPRSGCDDPCSAAWWCR
jgi:hypothetical protein